MRVTFEVEEPSSEDIEGAGIGAIYRLKVEIGNEIFHLKRDITYLARHDKSFSGSSYFKRNMIKELFSSLESEALKEVGRF